MFFEERELTELMEGGYLAIIDIDVYGFIMSSLIENKWFPNI